MNKITIFAIAAMSVMMLSSCSKGIKPASTDVTGDLAGCFVVVDQESPVNGDKVTVSITATDLSVPYQEGKVGVFADDNKANVMAGLGIELLDKDGNVIGKVKPTEDGDDTPGMLETLTSKPGTTTQLTFSDDAVKEAASFRITSAVKILRTGDITLSGAISKYTVPGFTMDANFEKERVDGRYRYSTSPAGAYLPFTGTVTAKEDQPGRWVYEMRLEETGDYGFVSGEFEGQLVYERQGGNGPYVYTYTGTMVNYQARRFNFTLTGK